MDSQKAVQKLVLKQNRMGNLMRIYLISIAITDTQYWAGALCHRDHTSPLPIRPLYLFHRDLFDREREPIWPGTYLAGNLFGREPIWPGTHLAGNPFGRELGGRQPN